MKNNNTVKLIIIATTIIIALTILCHFGCDFTIHLG